VVTSLHAAQRDFIERQVMPLVETVIGTLENATTPCRGPCEPIWKMNLPR
jgi:hypothetical protein